jgi:hypothetical protein
LDRIGWEQLSNSVPIKTSCGSNWRPYAVVQESLSLLPKNGAGIGSSMEFPPMLREARIDSPARRVEDKGWGDLHWSPREELWP